MKLDSAWALYHSGSMEGLEEMSRKEFWQANAIEIQDEYDRLWDSRLFTHSLTGKHTPR